VLGVDLGGRRVGLAISDPSATLARPLTTLAVTSEADAIERVAAEAARLSEEEDGLGAIVVGVPARLDGSPTDQTTAATAFMTALAARVSTPVFGGDERLTSREAETRLAVSERDWRRRKKKLDAAAAAVILQDYLDRLRTPGSRLRADTPPEA
jgi:putative Holliday junction resolvase